MIDFSILRFNFFGKESIVESLKVFRIRFEKGFSHLIEHGYELVFSKYFLLLESFFLFIFVVDLSKELVKMRESEFIAKNTTIKNEHKYLRVFKKIGIGFCKVTD